MARLNQPPDPSYTTPATSRTSYAVAGTQLDMHSRPPRPLSLDTSLQSHSNDNRPVPPPHQGCERSSLSPADCRTLEKILRDVASPPASPSPLEQSDQPFLDSGRASTVDAAEEDGVYHFSGGEATDTGYEDEDDSMELSEDGEVVTAKKTITPLGDPTSPSISKSDRRLQESVSAHDEKDKLSYSGGRRSSTKKRAKVKRPEQQQESNTPLEAMGGDTIEDIMNLPGERTQPARPLDLGRSDSYCQAVSDDIKQLNRMRLSIEKMLEHERMEQERAESDEEPGLFVSTFLAPQDKAKDRRKILQGSAPETEAQTSPIVPLHDAAEDTTVLVPSTPTSVARTSQPAHIQFATNQSAPETPFTKTLSYFKQYKGVENSPSKRRRSTALPNEIAEVAEAAVDAEVKTGTPGPDCSWPEGGATSLLTPTSALANLETMRPPKDTMDAASAAHPVHEVDEYHQASASTDAPSEQTLSKDEVLTQAAANDDQKQIILYPQHPAFVNAIGMIPATMFWVTAAPVVKYANIAVELLIDKLRDTYL